MTKIAVTSGVDQEKRIPLIAIEIDGVETIIGLPMARKIAMWLLDAAAQAEGDSFVVSFFEKMGAPPEALQAILGSFRQHVEETREREKEFIVEESYEGNTDLPAGTPSGGSDDVDSRPPLPTTSAA